MESKQLFGSEVKIDQQRENYERAASGKAQAETSFIDKLLGRGLTKEEVIINDAKAEDKYRSLLNEGKINTEEFRYLVENDIEVKEGGLGIIDTSHIIDGFVRGNRITIQRKSSAMDDNYISYSYKTQINGQDVEMSREEEAAIFNELIGVAEKKKQILDKIAKAKANEIMSGRV